MLHTKCIFTMLVLLACLPLGSAYAKEVPEGLVLYYTFEQADVAEIRDDSDSGNLGAVKGNLEWIEGPEGLGTGVRFAANSDYIEVADAESLCPDFITISLWIRSELTAGSIEKISKFTWTTSG